MAIAIDWSTAPSEALCNTRHDLSVFCAHQETCCRRYILQWELCQSSPSTSNGATTPQMTTSLQFCAHVNCPSALALPHNAKAQQTFPDPHVLCTSEVSVVIWVITWQSALSVQNYVYHHLCRGNCVHQSWWPHYVLAFQRNVFPDVCKQTRILWHAGLDVFVGMPHALPEFNLDAGVVIVSAVKH